MSAGKRNIRSARPQVMSVVIGMSVFHLACLLAFYTGVSGVALAVAVGMYVVRIVTYYQTLFSDLKVVLNVDQQNDRTITAQNSRVAAGQMKNEGNRSKRRVASG